MGNRDEELQQTKDRRVIDVKKSWKHINQFRQDIRQAA